MCQPVYEVIYTLINAQSPYEGVLPYFTEKSEDKVTQLISGKGSCSKGQENTKFNFQNKKISFNDWTFQSLYGINVRFDDVGGAERRTPITITSIKCSRNSETHIMSQGQRT